MSGAQSDDIRVIFILGKKPIVTNLGRFTIGQVIEQRLAHINGRVLYYEELLRSAQRLYREYRSQKETTSRVDRIIESLESLS